MTAIQERPDVTATVPNTAPSAQRPGMARMALLLGAFVAIGPLTIDMYLPALPTITTQLETTSAAVQLTLTGTLVGLALGQLVLGPVSDALGRKRPLLAGTALHVLASLLVLVAPNLAVLGGLRVLQGVGTAAGAVIAIAIVRDLYDGRAAATMLSRLFLVLGAAPVLAPTIGGELLRFTSWRGIFALLAVYGVLMVVVGARALPETLPPERRQSSGVVGTLRGYRSLFRDRAYVGLVLFGAGAFWLIAATQANPLLLRRFSPQQLLVAGTVAGAAGGAALVMLAGTGTGGLPAVVVSLWVVLFACGLALPNAPALALSRHGEAAGTAAALLGAVQFGVGAVVSPVVGLLGNDAVAIGAVVVTALALAIAVLGVVVRPWELPVPDDDALPAAAH